MLVGEHGSGRTSLVNAYKRIVEGSDSMIDLDDSASCSLVAIVDTVNGMKVRVLCMDSFNEDDFELECRQRSIRNANLCLLVMDVSEATSFDSVPRFIEQLIKYDYCKTLLLVGTKGDLGTSAHAAVENFMAEPHLIPIEYYVVSGESGDGVAEVFRRAVELGLSKRTYRWQIVKGLLFIYTRAQIDSLENLPSPSLSLGNLCEAIPLFLRRKKPRVVFPVHKLSIKHLRQVAELV
jgi:hypothetical protein